MTEEKNWRSALYEKITGALLDVYARFPEESEARKKAELLLNGLSEGEQLSLGSMIRGQMYRWDEERRGRDGQQRNPYAGVVYSLFPPVGGA